MEVLKELKHTKGIRTLENFHEKKSIIVIGPFPPPIGGVSVHISRLVNKLGNQFNIIKINTSKNRWLQFFKFLKALILALTSPFEYIVHNHVFSLKSNFIIVLLSKIFRIKYIQTFHSFRININDLTRIEISLFKYIIRNSYKIIVVNEVIREILIEFDTNTTKANIIVIPAFLPYDKIFSEIEKNKYVDTLDIDKFTNSHDLILCANGYKISFYNNEDLYGIDLCIELMRKLKSFKKMDVGLIFMLPKIGDDKYFHVLKKRILEYELEEDFIFINKEEDLVPLFEYIDIFLRPTNTDGDALSIREALYEGVPTIASDVVTRPSGTITFKNRDVEDFYEKVNNTIENIDYEKRKVCDFKKSQDNIFRMYTSVYN